MITRFHRDLLALTLSRFGFDGAKVEQGTPEWHMMRLGVITASRAKELIGRDRSGHDYSATHKNLRRDLVSNIRRRRAGGQSGFKQTEHGHKHEGTAREIFSFNSGKQIHSIPFIYGDMFMRHGCSPDGLVEEEAGLEIKCPFDGSVFLDFLLDGEIKPEYTEQCQFSMFVTGLPAWHFCNYDADAKVASFHSVVIERDEARMKTFRDAVDQMTFDMDSELARMGIRFGFQWEQQLEEAA